MNIIIRDCILQYLQNLTDFDCFWQEISPQHGAISEFILTIYDI